MNTDSDPRPLKGEPLAVDLLNTKTFHSDLLDDPVVLAAWLKAIGQAKIKPSADQIRRLRQTRTAVEAIFLSASNPDTKDVEETELSAVNEILAKGTPAANRDLSITLEAPNPWQLPLTIISNALELAHHRPQRLRQCQHEKCILWFHDTSKAGRRRWCSMERCGNRKKAQRNYHKKAHSKDL